MRSRLYLTALFAIYISLSGLVAGENVNCAVSEEELPEIPEDIGPRARSGVMQKMATPYFYDKIMDEPICNRVGSILLAITIKPSGNVINVKTLGSTLPNNVVEKFVIKMVTNLNFGKIDSKEYSTVYVPLVFKGW